MFSGPLSEYSPFKTQSPHDWMESLSVPATACGYRSSDALDESVTFSRGELPARPSQHSSSDRDQLDILRVQFADTSGLPRYQ
jgi:hypothetical protein